MDILRFMTAGSVDDGKSTLIGRLFHDAGLILDDQMNTISKHGLNLAFFTDGLKEEREKGITIDVAYRYFETAKRKFIVADAPGHREFTRNMVTGATYADSILILVDATRGVSEQTKRHAFLSQWLGVRSVAFLVNKMDLIQFSEKEFKKMSIDISLLAKDAVIIPISALQGENVLNHSQHMPWYQGPNLFEWLHAVPGMHKHLHETAFLPVQLTSGQHCMGTLKAGSMKVGEEFDLNGQKKIRLEKIFAWPSELNVAQAGSALRLQFDQNLRRGDFILGLGHGFKVKKEWEVEWCYLLEEPFSLHDPMILRYHTKEIKVESLTARNLYDLDTHTWKNATTEHCRMNEIYQGSLVLESDLCAEPRGHFAIINPVTGHTMAAGLIRR